MRKLLDALFITRLALPEIGPEGFSHALLIYGFVPR